MASGPLGEISEGASCPTTPKLLDTQRALAGGSLVLLFPLCHESPVLPGHRLLQQGRGEKAVTGPTFHHSPLQGGRAVGAGSGQSAVLPESPILQL